MNKNAEISMNVFCSIENEALCGKKLLKICMTEKSTCDDGLDN